MHGGLGCAAPGLIYALLRTVNPVLSPPQAGVNPENKDAVCSHNLCPIKRSNFPCLG